ncbi:MAG: 3-phosphoshikimate 1-carboxyvinyltransferase [Chloroflexota bacterium]|nr:3-phosphoshikimate 1-carboxyvinyltransferase [Chloroflexota bacterium]
MTLTLSRPARVAGVVVAPGDKSISHRALVLAALATGRSRIEGRAPGQDQESMVACLRALGVEVTEATGATRVHGVGLRGLRSPATDLDCGNSGATMRFLTGALAGTDGVAALLAGDASLARRPMDRVAAPLRLMGADVATAPGGLPPVRVTGRPLHGAEHDLPVASAQVKTAILLAGLNADGETVVREPGVSRDHTERMLARLGVDVTRGAEVRLRPPPSLPMFEMTVPGDPSSAAFWAVLAAAHPHAELTIENVCLNPTRAGFLGVLGRMGAVVEMSGARDVAGEAVADLHVTSSGLAGVTVAAAEVPSLVDEVPVLAVAAATATGDSVFHGIGELRVKEVDRLAAIVAGLQALGVETVVDGDDLTVRGAGGLRGGALLDAGGDHRMAMTWAVAGSLAGGETTVVGEESAAVSYPGFLAALAATTN